MTRTIGVLNSAASPLTEKRVHPEQLINAVALRAISFFRRHRDRDIERFIQLRGGVMSDDTERALGRRFDLSA